MALTLGTRLGVYEIIAPIGEGGMGQVFRARDTKLDRDVAIKILPEAFAHDADRLARFTREAKTLASLNHPNIAGIYGLEESGGVSALVMELVEGDDLSQRIAKGAIPIDEALPIAKQIAEALEAAHEQGIIHRDLKPANVKVRPDGTVKVLDFGLAKAFEPGGTSAQATVSPTLSIHATQAGVILGTAAYMSPEQAAGKAGGQAERSLGVWRRVDRDADGAPGVRWRNGFPRARLRVEGRARLDHAAAEHSCTNSPAAATVLGERPQAAIRGCCRRHARDRRRADHGGRRVTRARRDSVSSRRSRRCSGRWPPAPSPRPRPRSPPRR